MGSPISASTHAYTFDTHERILRTTNTIDRVWKRQSPRYTGQAREDDCVVLVSYLVCISYSFETHYVPHRMVAWVALVAGYASGCSMPCCKTGANPSSASCVRHPQRSGFARWSHTSHGEWSNCRCIIPPSYTASPVV